MRRAFFLTLLLVGLDLGSKALAEAFLPGRRLLLLPGFGLTYKVNHGIWLNKSLPPAYFPWLRLEAAIAVALVLAWIAFYRRYYRRSIWVDLLAAAFVAGTLGNIFLDRWLTGGIRDFIITPIAVANLADLYGSVLLPLAFAMELLLYPRARRLFRLTPPARWWREGRMFWHFVRIRLWRPCARRFFRA